MAFLQECISVLFCLIVNFCFIGIANGQIIAPTGRPGSYGGSLESRNGKPWLNVHADRKFGYGQGKVGANVGTDFGRNWNLGLDLGYKFKRGNLGVRGGTDFRRNWNVGLNAGYKFKHGGQLGLGGGIDSRGNKNVGIRYKYRWGRKRRSIEKDIKLQEFCRRCISIQQVTSQRGIEAYTDDQDIDFAMVAKFKKIYYNSTDTVISFKVSEVLEEPPTYFNVSSADIFMIDAKKGACAGSCLKSLLPGEYLVTGEMFNGRLIIHGNILLLQIPKKKTILN